MSQPPSDAQELRARLRTDLVAAMRARDTGVVAALRTAIAAIDNAEAVEVDAGMDDVTSEHVAGAESGVGSTEAARRVLSLDDLQAVLRAQVGERLTEAERYASYDRAEDAERLRREAEALGAYLPS